jgi:hypothetical protein
VTARNRVFVPGALAADEDIHVGADNGRDHGVAPAGHCVTVLNNGPLSAGNLDGPDRVARVDDVGRVRPGTEGLRAGLPFDLGPGEAQTYPVCHRG